MHPGVPPLSIPLSMKPGKGPSLQWRPGGDWSCPPFALRPFRPRMSPMATPGGVCFQRFCPNTLPPERILRTPLKGVLQCDRAPAQRSEPPLRTPITGSRARINMMRAENTEGGGQPHSLVLHPMALEVIKRTPKPQFSGATQDLPKFKRDWHTYVKVMQGCYTTPISDFVIIHSFLDCLKGGPAGLLTQMVSENPQITMGDRGTTWSIGMEAIPMHRKKPSGKRLNWSSRGPGCGTSNLQTGGSSRPS